MVCRKNTAMFGTVLLFTASLYSVCVGQEQQQQCNPPGWFGESCQFLCHCAGDVACRRSDGYCSSGCDPDWFGPGCQYDVSEFTAVGEAGSDLAWLTDNNDTTCNNGNIQSVTVALDTPHALHWIRIVVKDAAHLSRQVQLSYLANGSVVFCHWLRSVRVDDTTLDLSCRFHKTISHVTLSGNIVGGLCSLYISGGRNLALGESAELSTTLSGWDAAHAVDGDPGVPDGDTASFRSTCSHSLRGNESSWTMTFSREYVEINRFLIYNRRQPSRTGCCENFLVGFSLETPSRFSPYIYTDPGTSDEDAQDVYTVVPPHRLDFFNGSTVRIKEGASNDNDFLVLCEVYAFGEIYCPAGSFGRLCERLCNCFTTEECFVSTGGCPSGCALGYTGEDCYTECPATTFGRDCRETCRSTCLNSECHHLTGECNGCEPGYTGFLCDQDCPVSTYGPGCNTTCSAHCLDRWCHHVTGKCFRCTDDRTGAFCEEVSPQSDSLKGSDCPVSTYGPGCSFNCSAHCLDRWCHHVTGICVRCTDGRTGDFCEEVLLQTDDSNGSGENVGVIVGAVVAVFVAFGVAAAIIFLFLWRRRERSIKRQQSSEDTKVIDGAVTAPQPEHPKPVYSSVRKSYDKYTAAERESHPYESAK